MGFTHVQAATNGIELADLEFARKAKAAGLNTLYLQFDGVTDDVYLRTRGEALLETKMKVIENCRPTGMKIVFVPRSLRASTAITSATFSAGRGEHRYSVRNQLSAGRVHRPHREARTAGLALR
jgi:hypothetical protein